MPKLFICYRREDSAAMAGRIYDRLQAQFGRSSVFMDVDAIPLGVDFRQHINNMVSQCDIFLAIIGKHWLAVEQNGTRRIDDPKDFVRIEIEAALMQNISVIPILIDNISLPKDDQLPPILAELVYRNAAAVDSGRDFHNHIDRLIAGIEYLLKNPRGSRLPPPTSLAQTAPLSQTIRLPQTTRLPQTAQQNAASIRSAAPSVLERSIAQRLLLLYPPSNTVSWGIHITFYMLLGIILLFCIGKGVMIFFPTTEDSPTNTFFLRLLLLFGTPLVLLNLWANYTADQNAREQSADQSAHRASKIRR